MNDATSKEIPSPCGVLVLKTMQGFMAGTATMKFRPLAGFWFLNLAV